MPMILQNPIFWMGLTLIGTGVGIKLGEWVGKKEKAKIGKTRKEYWAEQFTVADNVFRIVMPHADGNVLRAYSSAYAEVMTRQLYGKEKEGSRNG